MCNWSSSSKILPSYVCASAFLIPRPIWLRFVIIVTFVWLEITHYVLCLLFYGYGLLPSLCCYSVGACGSPTPLSAAGFRRADTSPGRKNSPSRKIQAKNFLMWIERHQFFSFSSLIPIILSHALLYIRELPLLNEPKKLDQSSTHQ